MDYFIVGDFSVYHLYVRTSQGQKEYLTFYPMPLAMCKVMKSKQSDQTINKVQFEKVQL